MITTDGQEQINVSDGPERVQFTDELDRAAHIANMANERAVADARWRARPEQVQNEDGTWPITECVDCDGEIGAERLAMGKVRCVHCQHELEVRSKQYAAR